MMDIEFDSHGQPVGENSGKLASKSGDLVRTHAPITFKDWRKAKAVVGNDLWDLIKKEYNLPLWYKLRWLKGLKEPFRKYKAKLRNKYLDTCDTNEMRLNNVPDGIRREDWADFVAYEATAKAMNIRETNAKNRQALDVYHTSGRHGSARVAHMMNKKRKAAGAKPVTRVDVWIETHTSKDGSTSKTVAPIMGQVKQLNSAQTEEDSQDILQDPLTKVLGLDKGGRTRGVGSTVSRTQVLASIPAQEKLAELEKERNVKDQTINVLKSDVEYLKSTVADIKDWCTRNQHGSSCSQHEAASTSSVAATPAPNDCSFSNNVLYRLLDSQRKVAAHGQVIVQDVPLAVHGIPVGDDEVKVCIRKVFLPGSLLTSPNSFARTIGEVGVGGYAIWLKHRVASKPKNDKI